MSLAMRTRKGTLQTGIITYKGHDRTITFIGTIHIAEQGYYNTLAERVQNLENNGAKVLFEGVKDNPDEERTTDEANLIKEFSGLSQAYRKLADALGLQVQHSPTAFPVQPNWRNTDVSLLTFLRANPNFAAEVKKLQKATDELDELNSSKALKTIRWAIRHTPLLSKVTGRLPSQAKFAKGLLDDRNEVALREIFAEKGDVVTIWGAGHHKGIHKGLTENGYTVTHNEWVNAISKA